MVLWVGVYFACALAVAALLAFERPRRWLDALRPRGTFAAGTGPRLAWAGVAALLLAGPPLLFFGLRGHHRLEGYAEAPAAADGLVAQLLRGEQLVPPPALPPEVFATAEVALVRPALARADRRWDGLDAGFRQRLLLVFKLMRERHGYEMALLEGWRSPQRQDELAALGPQVTHARAWQSWHQWGLAADCAFLREGRLVISERDPWAMRGYQLYGELAESLGLGWGGRWELMDLGHVEWPRPGVEPPR